MTDIKNKDLRYTIKAIIDIPADEPESIQEYLEHLQEVGDAAVVSVEVIDPGTPIPRIKEESK